MLVTNLGLEPILALFRKSHAKGGVDFDFPQSIAACCDRAVTCCDRAVTCCDRAESQCERAVTQCDRAVSQCGRDERGFRGSFHVNLCILTL